MLFYNHTLKNIVYKCHLTFYIKVIQFITAFVNLYSFQRNNIHFIEFISILMNIYSFDTIYIDSKNLE